MMFQIVRTPLFDRDVKKFVARGGDVEKLRSVLAYLKDGHELPRGFKDHQLQGKLKMCRELHVGPDCLLVYEKHGQELRVVCLWLVSHKKLRERQRAM